MRKKHLYNIISKIIPFAGDVAIVYMAFNLAYYLRFYSPLIADIFPVTKGIPEYLPYHNIVIGICFLWAIIFVFSGMYYRQLVGAFDEFIQVFKSVTLATVIIIAATFLYKEEEYSRLMLAFSWGMSLLLIYMFHQLIKIMDTYLLYRLFGPRRVLILGNGKTTEVFKRYFNNNPKYRVYYHNEVIKIDELTVFCSEKHIEELIITSLKIKHDELSEISNVCDGYGIDFRIVPDILELRMGELIIDGSFGLPLLRIKPVSLYGLNRIIKRIVDVGCSILFMGVFFFPLMIISILIKLETKGCVLYVQNRVGYKGNMFKFFKFRSMVYNADLLLEDLKGRSERKGPVFKMKSDPRITFIGKLLRKASLDELPQVINVLKGDMSIIGPRPQVIWEAEAYDSYAKKRLNVLPGITGLWQVSGRATLSYEDMIRLDIYYIENWSLGLDLKILLKTIPTVLFCEGAY
ncbi:MAG: sugar transferase [bacterium]